MPLHDNANNILMKIGLSGFMVSLRDHAYYHDVSILYDQSVFKFYTPSWYRQSNHIKELDEVYRISTTVFLHLYSGLRCEYDIHEYYFEGEEYKLSDLFVFTLDNDKLDVLDADFEKEQILTARGNIDFVTIKRSIEAND